MPTRVSFNKVKHEGVIDVYGLIYVKYATASVGTQARKLTILVSSLPTTMPITRNQKAASAIAFRAEVGDAVADEVNAQRLGLMKVCMHVWFPEWAQFPANVRPWEVRSENVCVRTHRCPVEYQSVRHQLMHYMYSCWPNLTSKCDEVDLVLRPQGGRMSAVVKFTLNAHNSRLSASS
jgi:hypothetical protein